MFTKDKIVNCFIFRANGHYSYRLSDSERVCVIYFLLTVSTTGPRRTSAHIHCTWFWTALAALTTGTLTARDKKEKQKQSDSHPKSQSANLCWLSWVKADIKKNTRQTFQCKACGVLFPFIGRMFVFMDGCRRGHNHTEKQREIGWLGRVEACCALWSRRAGPLMRRDLPR